MPMPRAKPFVLCADDFGLSEGVSRGILELAERSRLSATSCMTVAPGWPVHAVLLRPLIGRIDIGLHLTLTDQHPLGRMPRLAPDRRLPPLGRLIRLAWQGSLDPREIAAEIDRQLLAFEAATGRPPDFVDGHQHVHLLPVVREAVIQRLIRLAARAPVYVRSCWDPLLAILRRRVAVGKSLFLAALGRPLRREVQGTGIAMNDSFRGVRDFSSGIGFGRLFRRFLVGPGERPLVMCHPGHPDAELAALDPVVEQRRHELAYLASDSFLADLAAAGMRPARFAHGQGQSSRVIGAAGSTR
jgi:predicted glycoside hydrolase/deacetylase ChbG (UPF0249 family)